MSEHPENLLLEQQISAGDGHDHAEQERARTTRRAPDILDAHVPIKMGTGAAARKRAKSSDPLISHMQAARHRRRLRRSSHHDGARMPGASWPVELTYSS